MLRLHQLPLEGVVLILIQLGSGKFLLHCLLGGFQLVQFLGGVLDFDLESLVGLGRYCPGGQPGLHLLLVVHQAFQRGRDRIDLLSQRLILGLVVLPPGQGTVGALGCLLEGVELFAGGGGGVRQQALLLGQQLGVTRVHFQRLFHRFQLFLGSGDLLVGPRQGFVQLCGVAADLNGDAFDFICHRVLLKSVHVLLGGQCGVLQCIVRCLGVHLVDHTDGQQVHVTDRDPKLYRPEEEERRGDLPVYCPSFFLAMSRASVLASHRAQITGKIL